MRIVKAGARKMSKVGIHSNIGLTSAIFLAKYVSTQKNTNRVTARKVPKKMYAVSEEKNVENSFLAILAILLLLNQFTFHLSY